MKRLILWMVFFGYVSGIHNTYGTHSLVIPTKSKSIMPVSTFSSLDREHQLSVLSVMISELPSVKLVDVFNNIRDIDDKSSDELSDLWNTVVEFCKQWHVQCHTEATGNDSLLNEQDLNNIFARYGSVKVCNYRTSEDSLREILGFVGKKKEQYYIDLRIPEDEVSNVLNVIKKNFKAVL